MRCIILFTFSFLLQVKSFAQTADEKEIYTEVIKKLIGKGVAGKSTILIYDSLVFWRQKENYSLVHLVNKKSNTAGEWDSVLKHFNFSPASIAVKPFFESSDLPKIKGHNLAYESKVGFFPKSISYWRIYLCPLYFNNDRTKCISVSEFMAGKCGTGAGKYFFFQKTN